MGIAALVLAGGNAHAQHVAPAPGREAGALEVSPAAPRLSVVVGDSARFTVAAAGAREFTWSVWGRVMSRDPVWEYVPAPEDAGWQRVQLDVVDGHGARHTHSWDVGVTAAVPPEVVDVSPAAGRVEMPATGEVTLRCAARVPAARTGDRLRFRWEVDDEVVQRDAPGGAAGSSELVVAALAPGTHRAVVRVTEDGRASSLVEWSLEVAPPEAAATEREAALAPAAEPAAPAAAAAVPATLPEREAGPAPAPQVAAVSPVRPRLVPRTEVGRIEHRAGDPVAVFVGVEPEGHVVTYEWTLDGRRVQHGGEARFERRALPPGQHRLTVSAVVDGAPVGKLVWAVVVRPTETAAAPGGSPGPPPTTAVAVARPREPAPRTPTPTAPPPPEPPPPEPPPRLAEADVRAWLEDYARAWSRKDVVALRRMGQVRSAADAERLERYFRSIDALQVEVRVLALHVEGDRALVELQRIDTVTDPTGRRELRLPALRKAIERTPEGLRFVDDTPSG